MMPPQFYYQLVVLGLLWLCVMLHLAWPGRGVTTQTKPAKPLMPRRQRSTDPKPFAGLTHKPPCALCEHDAGPPQALPPVRPAPPASPHGGHLTALLSPYGLSLSRLVGAGEPARQRPSQWRPVATMPVSRVRGRFPGASRHDLPWQARGWGADRARAGVLGGGPGYPKHGAGVRGRPEYRVAMAHRSSRAVAGLCAGLPARSPSHAGATR